LYQTKRLISEADKLISVSTELKKVALSIEKSRRTINVVYNGCDSHPLLYNDDDKMEMRTKLGILKTDKVIIFVGRIEKDKGIYELLSAFSILKSKCHNLHLILLGNCVESDLQREISSLTALKNKIHVIGEQPHREVFNWLKSADLFVLPSYHEGLPNAILEAMSCGLPVVSTKIGGIPEIVEDGNTGILVNPKDSDALANAIVYLIENDELARNMGKTGRDKVEQKFSWQQNAKEIVQIYNEVLSQ
jgi:glycosyltransferase involved in cell wall biosynthesis